MRKIVLLLMGVWACSSVCCTVWGYTIVDGQYEYGSVRLYNDETLLVTGGGAYGVEAFDSSYVEVQGTAPLSFPENAGGIYVLNLDDSSSLLVTGGDISGIAFRDNATAVLRGGSILHISSYQDADDLVQVGWDYENNVPIFRKHIELIVRDWSHDVQTNLLTGTWNVDNDNDDLFDTFGIQLHDQAGYDPTIENITFTIIPEPATLLLVGLGGLILRNPRTRV